MAKNKKPLLNEGTVRRMMKLAEIDLLVINLLANLMLQKKKAKKRLTLKTLKVAKKKVLKTLKALKTLT